MELSNITVITDPVDKRLYEKVKKVREPHSGRTFSIVQKMIETQKMVGAVGLAANQLGINQRIITAYHEGENNIYEFINPRIITSSCREEDIYWDYEGCLSHPGILAEVARFRTIEIIAERLNSSKEVRFQASGMISRIIQHEICHLNGLLITDMGKFVRDIKIDVPGQMELIEATKAHQEKGQEDFKVE